MSFRICAALPIKSGNLKENEKIIENVLKENPDIIELRLDYIDNVNNLTEKFLKQLLNLIQPNIPVILTFRNYIEGGQMQIDSNKRIDIIKLLIRAKPNYLDIEMNTDAKFLREIINLAQQNQITLIFSFHDFEKTPSFEECAKIINSFIDKLINDISVSLDFTNNNIFKMILTARNFEDNLIPFELCREFSKKNKKIICFCMGELGIISRLLCVKVGSILTFGSIEKTITAPGQIHIKKIRKFHRLIFSI
ncbi:MAG: type I 3-dehydroquinate dehydratase [Promethearchaeota archaeon]